MLSVVFALVLIFEIALVFLLSNDGARLMEREVPLLSKSHEAKLAVVHVEQYLTNISATRGQDGLDNGYKLAEQSAQLFRQQIKDLQELDSGDQDRYAQILQAFDKYYDVGKRMAQDYIKNDTASGNKLMKEFGDAAAAINQHVDNLLAQSREKMQKQVEDFGAFRI